MRPPRASRRQVLAGVPATLALDACAKKRPERDVTRVMDAQATKDGAGVRLKRSLGSQFLPLLDPFLLLDEIHSQNREDYLGGFPSHPHRGFETVTYMLDGAMEHRDSLGNQGRLGPGSVQWMTAGRGIIHSEMPKGNNGAFWGFQLWVNLPASLKMTQPRYQDLAPERVVEIDVDGAKVRVVAGEAFSRRGPVEGIVTAPHMIDVTLSKRKRFEHAVPASHNAFAYVLQGAALLGRSQTRATEGQIVVFGPGDVIGAVADGPVGGRTSPADGAARMLMLSAQPIGEPVARHGPFVMNTNEELQQAIDDYLGGRLIQGG